MSSPARNFIAKMVANHYPGLFYYMAKSPNRDNLKLKVTSTFIDITNKQEQKKIRVSRNNSVYAIDMINDFDYYFNSAAPIPVREDGKTYKVVDFSTPRFQQVAGFDDFPILCPSLTEPFITAQQYIDFAQIGPGDVVFDLGSYSSLTSIAFSKIVGPAGRVIALEPDPSNFEAAATNIAMHKRLNGLDNITLMQAAVSGKKGVMKLSSEGAMGSAEVSVVGNYRGQVIAVDMLTLQDLVEIHDIKKVNFIKMDIEGSEENTLTGADKFFRQFRPRIIIEPHFVNGVLSEKAVRDILEKYDYNCDTITQTGVNLPLVTGIPR